MKTKDWVPEMQMPKNIYDERPVKELNGKSYKDLTELLQKIKTRLSALEDSNALTVDVAKSTVNAAMNEELIREIKQTAQVKASDSKPTFTQFVSTYIHECETGERLKKKSTKKIKDASLKSYRGLLALLKDYEKVRHCIIDWDDLSFDFYDDFKRFLIDKNYKPNTIARNIKDMKTVLYAAKDMHYTTRDDFMSRKWSADREEVDNVYITSERIHQLMVFDMSDYQAMKGRAEKFAKDEEEKRSLVHALQRDIYREKLTEARDIFIMGCLTGQRVSDYKRINSDMIETIIGERKFLHIKQEKTGKDVYVPYSPEIATILDRYGGKLPKVYDQHLNDRIKVVALLMGWIEPAGLHEQRGLMSYTSDKRFCDAVMTHTARRSFATNAYKAGVPLSAIMAITGHSSEEMLKKYLKLGSKERALLAADEFDKIKTAL